MGWQLHDTHGHSHGGGGGGGHGHGEGGHGHGEGGHSHSENINVRAAFIHVVGDVLQSIGVFCAALVIYFFPTWKLADPICTFIFSVVVLFTTITILKDTLLVIDYINHLLLSYIYKVCILGSYGGDTNLSGLQRNARDLP